MVSRKIRSLIVLSLFVALLIATFVEWQLRGHHADTSGQPDRLDRSVERVTNVVLPARDHTTLVRNAEKRDQSGVYQFAVPVPVSFDPENSGSWRTLDNHAEQWRLNVKSAGALSVNLAFRAYQMPEGGTLSIYNPEEGKVYRDFTAADNDEHGELWTPVFGGDEVVIEATVPAGRRSDLQLELASVNHGFRGWKTRDKSQKIGGTTSASCNVDVACAASDIPALGAPLDFYRDQIRSVGAFTVGGINTCSGALINNTALDDKPYFLTAFHCQVRSNNEASVVVYWNYQNSTCRQPNSPASGGPGNGLLNQFNSGSIYRSGNSSSDFCLLELDDPIASSVNPFFAGWSRTGQNATMAVGIHHPSLAEKRFSFELNTTSITSYGETSVPGDVTNLRVSDWDWGTTEGGSSGSPLFDQNGRIIGQLQGGFATCGNSLSDWYGRFSVSWSNGTSSATRLRDWLDPINSGAVTLDGKDLDGVLTIANASITEGNGGTTNVSVEVTLDRVSSKTVTVGYQTASNSATSGSDFNSASGTLTFTPGQTSRTIPVGVKGDTVVEDDEVFLVNLSGASNAMIGDGQAQVMILTDDFPAPVITSSLTANAVEGAPLNYQIVATNAPTAYSLQAGAPTGMTINGGTGAISWVPSAIGTFNVGITATNGFGSDTKTLVISVVVDQLLTALDDPPLGFFHGSNSWFLQTATTHDGVDAAESANISNGQTSWFETAVSGPGTASFWWKVSSEAEFDFVQLLADGVLVVEQSGEVDWEKRTIVVPPGPSVLRWQYTKDGSVSDGADTAWIDELVFINGFNSWIATYDVSGLTAYNDDSDDDGIPQLAEYAFGMNPAVSDLSALPVIEIVSGLMQVTINKPPGVGDIAYEVEISPDMTDGSWTSAGTTVLTNTSTTLTVREATATGQRYMRVRVTLTPPA